ncbi:MAG TPA: zinc-binding dehydrogenase [Myxococcota bacterium]
MQTRALSMRAAGGPEVLEMGDLELPWPRNETDVLVRLHATSVNPADAYFRSSGPYLGEATGCVLGHDGAGVVEAIGSGVTHFQPGDRVCFCYGGIGGEPGNYALHTVVPEYVLAPIPDGVPFAQAAALPLVFITVWESLQERAGLREGEFALIHGGAGGTGHVGVQVARELGARVAATVSTPEKAELVAKLGAERPIIYPQEDFVRAALEWTGGRGVDVVLDNVGVEVLQRSFEALAVYGRAVALVESPADTPEATAYNRNLTIANVMMLTPMWLGMSERVAEQAAIVARGVSWLAEGRITVHVGRTFPLERGADAHRCIEAGGSTGKIVLTMSD